MTKLKNILSHAIIITSILIIASLLIIKVTQNDIFFDLKTGQNLFKFGLDFKDHFSFIPNLTYLYHHYLYDIIIYKVYEHFNFPGIFYFFLLIYSLLGIIVYITSYKTTHNKLLSFCVSLITMFLLRNFYTNRIQTITYILFFLEVYYLHKFYNTGHKKYSVFLFLISILIANLHMPIWIFTIILCLPFILEIILIPILNKYRQLKKYISSKIIFTKPANSKLFILTFIILILSGLLTPLKFYPYTFSIKALGNQAYNFIYEMQPLILIKHLKYLILLSITFIIIFILKTKIKFSDLILIIGLFVFSLIAYRNLAYVYLLYPFLLIKILYENYSFPSFKFSHLSLINQSTLYFTLLICLSLCYIFSLRLYQNFDYNYTYKYPTEIVKYIKNNLNYNHLKFYNDFNYGSYLAFNDIPVFIDSRVEVYTKEFNGGKDIISDYQKTDKYNTYKEIFLKYNFDYAIVYYQSPLSSYLQKDPDYNLIYNENDSFALFQKS